MGGGGGGSAPAPVTNNYEETMREALEAQIDLAPDLYQAEANNWYGRPAYARMEQDIIADALLGEEKYIYGPGKEPERYGGGAAYLIGGNQKTKFSNGQTRKAGYSADGKKFLGTSQFEQDLLERSKQQQTATEVMLADQYGSRLTNAYRSQGLVQDALNDVTRLSNEGSYREYGDRMYHPLIDLRNYADATSSKISDVSAPSQAEEVSAPAKARDSIAQAMIDLVDPRILQDPAGVATGIITGKDVLSENISSDKVASDKIGLNNLRDNLTSQAESDLAAGGDLTEQEIRNVQQDARAAATARGRVRDYGSVVNEVENLDSARRQRQAERRAFAGQTLGQEAGLRSADIGVDLQADLANQQAGLQASQANQQLGLQAALANQANSLQAQQINEANSLQAQLANQQAGMQVDLANQGASMQASLANQQANLALADQATRVSMANQQADLQGNQFSMQAALANQQAEMQADAMNMEAQRLNQIQDSSIADRKMTAAEKDINRSNQIKQYNTQMRMQGLLNDRQFAAQRVGLEQATSSDPFMAITGRPSGAAVTTGQALYGNGQSGIGAGPNLFNPAQGAEWIANQSAMVNSYNAANYSAQQSRKAGMFSGAMGAVGTIGGAMLCWVAREVYGVENPKWLEFREWVKNDSPSWFFKFYLNYGEKIAEYISDKPKLKWVIRKWMDSRIRR